GGEELAVALVRSEEEVVDRVEAVGRPRIEGVLEVARVTEVGLDRGSLVVGSPGPRGVDDALRERVDLVDHGRRAVAALRQVRVLVEPRRVARARGLELGGFSGRVRDRRG